MNIWILLCDNSRIVYLELNDTFLIFYRIIQYFYIKYGKNVFYDINKYRKTHVF